MKRIAPGDVLYRTKDGVFDHPALVMPGGMVYENRPEQGEHLAPLDDFIQGSSQKTENKAR